MDLEKPLRRHGLNTIIPGSFMASDVKYLRYIVTSLAEHSKKVAAVKPGHPDMGDLHLTYRYESEEVSAEETVIAEIKSEIIQINANWTEIKLPAYQDFGNQTRKWLFNWWKAHWDFMIATPAG